MHQLYKMSHCSIPKTDLGRASETGTTHAMSTEPTSAFRSPVITSSTSVKREHPIVVHPQPIK